MTCVCVVNIPTVDGIPDIRYLDFTVSNKCNLACIHCNPFVLKQAGLKMVRS